MAEQSTEVESYVITSGWDSVVMTLTRVFGPQEPLTDAEQTALAVAGPFPPCTTCHKTRGIACVTPKGAITAPHKPRRDMVIGYLARTPEVTALRTQLDQGGDD